jgi:gluconolactonase
MNAFARTLSIASLAAATLGTSTNASMSASPEASIDLATREGVRLVKGEWRYSDTRIIEVDFAGPGPDGQPTGAPVRTYDYVPKAGAAGFDDSQWDVIDATTLTQRRSTGRICFNWYRINITIPERIGGYDPTGADVELETAIDDYAEIWVDGELPRALGQDGGSVVAGWNAANRLVIGRGVRPGQRIQLAVFGINGPLSNPPTNFIWMRYARLHFLRASTAPGPIAVTPQEVNVEVVRKDVDAMQAIVGANPKLFKLAEGFAFTEGPVWVPETASPDAPSTDAKGALLFSDPNRNTIYRYAPDGAPDGALTVFRANSGYDGADIAVYKQPGSNGLALDAMGRLAINEHGNRRVSRLEPDGRLTVLADRYEGKRLNSPNDLVYRSDGALFFTDPPFGLPKGFADPRKELSFGGIYMLHHGALRTIATDLAGPNGIALSPDERFLYVGNWDDARKVVMRYEATSDGSYGNGRVLFDMTAAPGEDAIDGIKVDAQGHLYVSGPGGLWILSPNGRHLGTIVAPRHIHNMAWGDADRQTLYLCARDRLYRIRLNVPGAANGALRTGSNEP